MTREEAIAILENEKECVNRANKNDYCNRDCYNCELVKTDTEILTALNMAINSLEVDEQYQLEYEEIKPISALSENKGEWIPVSERLPEVDQNVLATTKWGDITIAERLNIGPDCWFIYEGEANAHTEDIVAWQPLPEPYKAESEEQG